MVQRAICVGINDYSARSDCPSLPDARPDAESWKSLLTDAFNFDAGNVALLTDGAATRRAVLATLTEVLKQSSAGDVVCFYFAGHGGRGTGSDASTYYESICCADAGGDITDVEINQLAAGLQPSYVNFTLVLDSCHSGGVFDPPDPASASLRAKPWSSGDVQQFASSCKTIVPHVCLAEVSGMQGNIAGAACNADGTLRISINEDLNFSDGAKATLLAACRYDQNAGSTGSHGYFTQALIDTINQCGFTITHPDLLSRVRQTIGNYTKAQTPQLRGRPVRLGENFLAGWTYSI
ncbi:MAG TPA: caspase family protein [Stellaceae bacterium]|nr:caspase family protein [Stellaceae bacterium]